MASRGTVVDRAHEAWISELERSGRPLRGFCVSIARQMARELPGLKVVCGFVELAGSDGRSAGECEHAWCVTEGGEVVDPTASQFAAIVRYRAFVPGDVVMVGRCMACGVAIMGETPALDAPIERVRLLGGATSRITCSAHCEGELRA